MNALNLVWNAKYHGQTLKLYVRYTMELTIAFGDIVKVARAIVDGSLRALSQNTRFGKTRHGLDVGRAVSRRRAVQRSEQICP